MVDSAHPSISIRRQCELLGLNRSTFYYQPQGESPENLELMRRIDELHTERPVLGCRMLGKRLGADKDRVNRLMRIMGIEAIYPKPRTTRRNKDHRVFPYLLRGVAVRRPDHVWSTDITYVPLPDGFMYLTAVIDWFSRNVLSWRLSNTLDTQFCVDALEEALTIHGCPTIFNTDQGCQFTSREFTSRLEREGIQISMDGRGRALDNVFVERLWRTVKYEDIYIRGYETVRQLESGLTDYFDYYCRERLHSSLDYRTPHEVYQAGV